MLEKFLHRKLLRTGERGKGVVTGRRDQAAESTSKYYSIRYELRGHIKFPDGTESKFRSEWLSSHTIGDIREGAIVPVRYDARKRSKVIVDVVALEETHRGKVARTEAQIEERKQRAIAEADAQLAQRNRKHWDGPRDAQ